MKNFLSELFWPKKEEHQSSPATQALRFFTPNVDFFSPELKSHYLRSATYTIKPGSTHDKLRELADGEWSRRKLIRFLPAHLGNGRASSATILGSALVKEK